ncbi:MAG: hypothetical protein R3320_02255 [Nitriliruptorales bacterium]|nr:hypothetical protein [Nitriliruptorales bacterium]
MAPPRKRHVVVFTLLYLLVAGGTVFGAVSLNALAAGDAVTARTLESQVTEAERDYGLLVAEVAQLEDPERVRRAALELGMVPADSPRYLLVERSLDGDGVTQEALVDAGDTTDPMKPVLSAER